jgi:broad specificity phosphatase PhoE
VSTLYLVRHGQASYGEPDYDRLSARGEEQARLLGEWFGRAVPAPDAVYHGPLRRQRDTAKIMARRGWPDPVEVEGLREYDAEAVMRQALPGLFAHDPELAAWNDAPPSAATVERIFQRVMKHWYEGRVPGCEAGTFQEFVARVSGALREIMRREGRGRSVVVVSSAGPVAVGMKLALEYPEAMALKMSWVVANSSITELRWREDETTLISFNMLPHLPSEKVTYR